MADDEPGDSGEIPLTKEQTADLMKGMAIVVGMELIANTCPENHVHGIAIKLRTVIPGSNLGVIPFKFMMTPEIAHSLTAELADLFMQAKGIDATMVVNGIRDTSPEVWGYMKAKGMVPDGYPEPGAVDADEYDFGTGVA